MKWIEAFVIQYKENRGTTMDNLGQTVQRQEKVKDNMAHDAHGYCGVPGLRRTSQTEPHMAIGGVDKKEMTEQSSHNFLPTLIANFCHGKLPSVNFS